MEVPKIFYQTWKTTTLPKKFALNRDEWLKSLGPGWKTPLLTDEDLRHLVAKNVPQHLKAYDRFTENIERVDFARYVMMWLGGVYADLDTYPLKSIKPFVAMGKIVLGQEPREHAIKIYDRLPEDGANGEVVCNAFMMSPPKLPFWTDLMNFITSRYEPHYKPVYNTGPMAITLFKQTHPEAFANVLITPACTFFPLTGDGSVTAGCDMEKDTYVVHVWENTWTKPWWRSEELKNRRYWFWAAMTIFTVFFILIFLRTKSKKGLRP
jgi:hypothetical protein